MIRQRFSQLYQRGFQILLNRILLKEHATCDAFPDGLGFLETALEQKEQPFEDLDAVLPESTVDLNIWRERILPDQDKSNPLVRRRFVKCARDKLLQMRIIFAEREDLLALHGLVIAVLRRRDPPARARELFFRMWQEHGDFLAQKLPARWLISAAVTFADHGKTVDQRMVGQALSLTFDLIKLHDSERRLLGVANDRAFSTLSTPHKYPLAFNLPPYHMKGGDLDLTLLTKIWRQAKDEPLIRPLAEQMLTLLLKEKRTVFARIQIYKGPVQRERLGLL